MVEVLYDLLQLQNIYLFSFALFLTRFLLYKDQALELYEGYLEWKSVRKERGDTFFWIDIYFRDVGVKQGYFRDAPNYAEVIDYATSGKYGMAGLATGSIYLASLALVFIPLMVFLSLFYLLFVAESAALMVVATVIFGLACIALTLKKYTDVIIFKHTLGK